MIGLGRIKVPLVLGFLRIWLLRYIFILCTESFLAYYSVFWGESVLQLRCSCDLSDLSGENAVGDS